MNNEVKKKQLIELINILNDFRISVFIKLRIVLDTNLQETLLKIHFHNPR